MSEQPSALQIPTAPLMFVDIEAGRDQAYIWLISVLVEGKPDSLRQFYAETPASENNILNGFLSYRKEFDGCTICYYGGFDERITRRQIATYELDSIGFDRWFDLHKSIKKSGMVSRESPSSLKYIASNFGYEFMHPDVDGTSVPWMYEQNVCKRDGATSKKLLEYGEDDVRAMQCIMSSIGDVGGICIDKSWTPSEHELPPSFEAQCALVKSLKVNDWSIPRTADRFCVSKKYVRTRRQAAPEELKGKKVSFEMKDAIKTGIPPDGAGSECGFRPCHEGCSMHGEVVEQVSENEFRIRVHGTIFQVHKDLLVWQ